MIQVTNDPAWIFGVKIDIVDVDWDANLPPGLMALVTVNTEMLSLCVTDDRFRHFINSHRASADGQWVEWFARFVRRSHPRIRKVSGSGLLSPLVAYSAKRGWAVSLIGGTAEEVQGAALTLSKAHGAKVHYYSPSQVSLPFPESWKSDVLASIRRDRPRVVCFALGTPKGSYLIEELFTQLEELGVRLVLEIGGAVRMAAGLEPRAPVVVQSIGLEGIWRSVHNPARFGRWISVIRSFPALLRQHRKWNRNVLGGKS